MCIIDYVESNKKPDDFDRQIINDFKTINAELIYLLKTERYIFNKSKYSKLAETTLDRTLKTMMTIEKMIEYRKNVNEIEGLKQFQNVISNDKKNES